MNWSFSCAVVLYLVTASGPGADERIIPLEAGLPVIDWQEAPKFVDQEVIVQGTIVATNNIGRMCFLNFDTARTFTAIVRQRHYRQFPQPPEKMYNNQVVRIRGLISEFKGRPQIEVSRPEQVQILEAAPVVPPRVEMEQPPFEGIVTLGTFNVLNLFDEHDDPYHSDEGTSAKPKEQLEKLAETIRKVNADVLALQEVENRGYLERFVAAYLGDLGYRHVVCIESNDRRGIDCAVLSRLPVGPVTSYRHLRFPGGEGEEMWFRRDLLQVRIEPPGYLPITVLVVHFKSKRGGGDTTLKYRLGEARQARKVLDEMLGRDREALFAICGDFNDTWASAPLRALRGSGPTALRDFLADISEGAATYNKSPHGMIDFILASPALGQRYLPKSYRVISGSVDSSGSDHNPVVARFDLKPASPGAGEPSK